jgi:hypothetical protein
MKTLITIAVLGAAVVAAGPAWADGASARDIQAAVDSYVATAESDATLVGGPGSAGYDAGFWIRGGDFSLRINLTLQARYEYWDWDDDTDSHYPSPGGDLSGFSLPRATVKFSGTAPCDIRYYMELEFGHPGEILTGQTTANPTEPLGPGEPIDDFFGTFDNGQTDNYSNTREAWIEWGCSPGLNIRMGQIKIPTTRQMMTSPELQQFVDVSGLSAFTGQLLPGYTDRNRDHGILVHGAFGCENEFSWMLAITNGDSGDSVRNIHDRRTDDNLSYSGRINWAFLEATGYEEGALRQTTCAWYGELGAWAYYHADRIDNSHSEIEDALRLGVDLSLGTGGFSFTGAFTYFDNDLSGITAWGALAQAGYLFPDTAWEIAGRFDVINVDSSGSAGEVGAWEAAVAVNYYLNGHGNKLTLDATWIDSDELGWFLDLYAGYNGMDSGNNALLVRFQWQLAL